jgi:hypothetical protein
MADQDNYARIGNVGTFLARLLGRRRELRDKGLDTIFDDAYQRWKSHASEETYISQLNQLAEGFA